MVFDQYVYGCQLLFMAVSYYIKTAAVRILLYVI